MFKAVSVAACLLANVDAAKMLPQVGVPQDHGELGFKSGRVFQTPEHYNTSSKRIAGVLNVHIVPHTHDDVGWLKTYDEYHYGRRNDIQRAQTQNILDGVIKELMWNPDRKFIYVEQAFFAHWWEERQGDPTYPGAVRQLVAEGRLEFINGGWCMHDEAATSFVDMIDNTHVGHRYIKENFGVMPKTTWQIDPFGHSGFQASMMSSPLSGFNAVYFARISWDDSDARRKNLTTETVWAPSPSQGLAASTMSGYMYGGYGPPGAADMAEWSSSDPIVDSPTSSDYNVGQIVDSLVNYAVSQSQTTRGDDIMWYLGSDFNYENAATWFTNTDKLIHYLNQDGRVNAFYSTPSAYTEAKLKTPGLTLPVKTDDYFPYADGPHAYWSGYFTSRAALKGYVRDSSAVFQAAKQIQTLTGGAADTSRSNPLFNLERAMGVTQHHDAVSGTSKQHVAYDYARQLALGRAEADVMMSAAFAKLTGFSGAPFVGCDLTNVTICPALEAGQPTVLLLWNQRSQAITSHPVRLPVGLPSGVASYAVFDNTATAVAAQLLPLSSEDSHLRTEYYAYNSSTPVQWLTFQVPTMPALGYVVIFLQPSATVKGAPSTVVTPVKALRTGRVGSKDTVLSNGVVSITISGSTGLVTSYTNVKTNVAGPLANTFNYYRSSTGTKQDGQSSGAYIFRTNVTTAFPVATGPVAVTLLTTGPVVWEARQVFSPWLSQVVRLYAGRADVDFEYTVGPIDWSDKWGKEVVAQYSTNLASASYWMSDSNGRDSIIRKRDYRSSWDYNVTEPVAGNYVPQTAFSYLSDTTNGNILSVVNDRAQGCASMADGELEVMVHRRLLNDDGRGVGEPLNETGLDGDGLIVRGVHRVSLAPLISSSDATQGAAFVRREGMADLFFHPLIKAAGTAGASVASWLAANKGSYTGLSAALPAQLHLLTAHSHSPTSLLIRLAHMYETTEDMTLSAPASVDLATMFNGITLGACEETTLTANQPLTAAPVTTYNTDTKGSITLPIIPAAPAGPGLSITLSSMQIHCSNNLLFQRSLPVAGVPQGESPASYLALTDRMLIREHSDAWSGVPLSTAANAGWVGKLAEWRRKGTGMMQQAFVAATGGEAAYGKGSRPNT